MQRTRSALARAHSNIALAKYWGKTDALDNRPAVPSLSLTLSGMTTRTRVIFDSTLTKDSALLDGKETDGRPLERIIKLLNAVRTLKGFSDFARVESTNDFPTAAGLASSASGFAALALAAANAAGLDLPRSEISSLARAASASAARSVFGGFVCLEAGARSAVPLFDEQAWPLEMLVAVTQAGAKSVSSSEGMRQTRATSPYYAAWLEHAPRLYQEIRAAVETKSLETLGPFVEQSALMMHASMFAAAPGIIYWTPATLRVIEEVRKLRQAGILAYFTIDAGPHVKILTRPDDSATVASKLGCIDGVLRIIETKPGAGAELLADS